MERSPSSSSQANDEPPSAHFHSQPSDLQLVQSYLRPWVDSRVKAGDFIHEYDSYAADPESLSRQFKPAVAQNGDRAWYFFTTLRSKCQGGKQTARTVAAGEGGYHGESKPKPVIDVLDSRRLVGYRQTLTFMRKVDGGKRVRSGWLMMELRLAPLKQQVPEGDIVLYKVYRSPRYHGEPALLGARRKREADEDDDDKAYPSPRTKGKSDGCDEAEGSHGTAGRMKSDVEGPSAATGVAASAPGKADRKIPVTVAPGLKGKKAEDEGSAEKSEMVSDGSKQKAVADDESSFVASAAGPERGKRKIDRTQQELHCPRCGCHLDAEAVLATAKSKQEETKPETEVVQVEGDDSVIEHKYHLFLRD